MEAALSAYLAERASDPTIREYAEMRKRQLERSMHQDMQTDHMSGLFHVARIEEALWRLLHEPTVSREEIVAYLTNEIAGVAQHVHPTRVRQNADHLTDLLTLVEAGKTKTLRDQLKDRISARNPGAIIGKPLRRFRT